MTVTYGCITVSFDICIQKGLCGMPLFCLVKLGFSSFGYFSFSVCFPKDTMRLGDTVSFSVFYCRWDVTMRED